MQSFGGAVGAFVVVVLFVVVVVVVVFVVVLFVVVVVGVVGCLVVVVAGGFVGSEVGTGEISSIGYFYVHRKISEWVEHCGHDNQNTLIMCVLGGR